MSENKLRPWDIFNKEIEKISGKLKEERLAICNDCEFFIKKVNICQKCGCQMNIKTTLAEAACPIGKWQAVNINIKGD
jgi:hypothetical protein